MKKTNFIISIAYIFIMLSLICFPVSASEVGTYFDAAKNSLVISGSIGSGEMTPVTVHISEYSATSSATPPTFSKQNTPLVSELLFTNENGALSVTVPLSNVFKNNKYTVHFYSTEDNGSNFYTANHFVCFNPESLEALEAIERINDASKIDFAAYKNAISINGMSLGIDLAEYTQHFDYASDITFSLISKMSGGKYTPITFRDNFFGSVAASMIKNNNDVPGAIASYFSQFGTTQDKYMSLGSNQRSVLDNLLKAADYKSDILSNIYSEKLSVSALVVESDREKFKNSILGNNLFGVSTDDATYKKIASSYRNLVFSDMFNERSTYTSAQNVLDSFNKNTAAILKKYPSGSDSGTPSGPSLSGPSSSTSTSTSTGTNILIPTPNPETIPPEASSKTFDDTQNHWAKNSIDFLVNLGAINGFPDNTFKPDNAVTRAEFAKIVCMTFGISGKYSGEFADVAESDWFAQSVSALAEHNIVTGYESLFSPYADIRREDAAVILYRLCTYLNAALVEGKNDFADSSNISDYALDASNAMAALEIIKGDNNKMFNPKNSLTRAEAATVIQRVYNLLEGGMSK